MTPAVTLVTILDPCTKNLLTMGQGEEMDRLLSAIKDHVESEADSSSTSMAVEDSSASQLVAMMTSQNRLASAVVCCKSTVLRFRLKKQFVQK